jgi:hypothetical protein
MGIDTEVMPFGQIPSWIVKRGVWKNLTKNEAKLLVTLVVHGDNKTAECWKTWDQLSESSGIHLKAIGSVAKSLDVLGCIDRKRRGNRMVYRVNRKEPEFAGLLSQMAKHKRRKTSLLRNDDGKFIPIPSESDVPCGTESGIPDDAEAAKSLASIEEQSDL